MQEEQFENCCKVGQRIDIQFDDYDTDTAKKYRKRIAGVITGNLDYGISVREFSARTFDIVVTTDAGDIHDVQLSLDVVKGRVLYFAADEQLYNVHFCQS